ncbi:CPBP family intramembrane glutamic endopeptidase [Deinococcus pimensis]|uniref:CPBP family intramembrane glutamic endopeptidase n=1 Tax=Deinococcus pimensis TaxID=309888 RepID=UPI0004BB94CF|nr:CPBP family intramembrane glutamic endopeptidase [Deinococcus pimensis]
MNRSRPVHPPRHPLRFALLVMLTLEGVLLTCLTAAKLLLPHVPLAALDLPVLLVNAVVAAVLLTRRRWWAAAGFTRTASSRDLLLTLPVLALLVVPTALLGVTAPPMGRALTLGVVTLLIAFQEEAIFRGALLYALSPLGRRGAVLGSALLFGVIHLNSLLVGRDPAFVAAQVAASILGGIGLAALRLRLGTIWPLIVLHALNDFAQFSAAGDTVVAHATPTLLATKLGVSALLALYGIALLRHPRHLETPAEGHHA